MRGLRDPDVDEPGPAQPFAEFGGEVADVVSEEHRAEGDGGAILDHQVLDQDGNACEEAVADVAVGFGHRLVDASRDDGVDRRVEALDADGDGILDSDEGTGDTDNDGTPDSEDTDSDGDTLTASVVDEPDNGNLAFNENGSFTYKVIVK